MSQSRKQFFNIYGIAMIVVVVLGSYAFYINQTNYAILAMSGIFMLMALEALMNKEINLRGKIVPKCDNPKLFYVMLCVYLLGAAICLFLALLP